MSRFYDIQFIQQLEKVVENHKTYPGERYIVNLTTQELKKIIDALIATLAAPGGEHESSLGKPA